MLFKNKLIPVLSIIIISTLLSCKTKKRVVPKQLSGHWSYYKNFTGYGIYIKPDGHYFHSYYSLKFLDFKDFKGKILSVKNNVIRYKIKNKGIYRHYYKIVDNKLFVANTKKALKEVIDERNQNYKKVKNKNKEIEIPADLIGSWGSQDGRKNNVFFTILKNGKIRFSIHDLDTNKITRIKGDIIEIAGMRIKILIGASIINVYYTQRKNARIMIWGYSETDFISNLTTYKKDSSLLIRGNELFIRLSN